MLHDGLLNVSNIIRGFCLAGLVLLIKHYANDPLLSIDVTVSISFCAGAGLEVIDEWPLIDVVES